MRILPLGKVLHICDDVVADPDSHKPSLLNLWEIIRLPAGSDFPYTLQQICVVALMRDGEGEIRFRVDLVQAETAEVIRQSREYPVQVTDRQRSLLVVVRLQDVIFPEEGTYLVEMYADDIFVDDRPITVIAPKEAN